MSRRNGELSQHLAARTGETGMYVADALSATGLDFYIVHSEAAAIVGGADPEKLKKLDNFLDTTDQHKTDLDLIMTFRNGDTGVDGAIYPLGNDDHRVAIVNRQIVLSREYTEKLFHTSIDELIEAEKFLIKSAVEYQISQNTGSTPDISWRTNGFGFPQAIIGEGASRLDHSRPFATHELPYFAEISFFSVIGKSDSFVRHLGYYPNTPILRVTNGSSGMDICQLPQQWERATSAFKIDAVHTAYFDPSEWSNGAYYSLKAILDDRLSPDNHPSVSQEKLIEVVASRTRELLTSFGGNDFKKYGHYEGLLNSHNPEYRRRALNLLRYVPRLLAVDADNSLQIIGQTGIADLIFGTDNHVLDRQGNLNLEELGRMLHIADRHLSPIDKFGQKQRRSLVIFQEWQIALGLDTTPIPASRLPDQLDQSQLDKLLQVPIEV